MRCQHYTKLFLFAGISAILTACGGGGGGGGPAITPIPVTAAKNPVLNGTSTTITANFANYTSTIKFGSTVNFAVSAPGTLSSATTKTIAGGIATVTVTSPQTANVAVSAGSGNFGGSTTVSFIPLPATASVVVTAPAAINSLGTIICNVKSDVSVTYSNFSSAVRPLPNTINPVLGSTTNVFYPYLITTSGINVTPASMLFKLSFTIPSASLAVPIFSIDQTSVVAAFADATAITPTPVLNLTPTYYDSTGKVLFP